MPETQTYADFNEDLTEEALEIMEVLGELREAWKIFFPSHQTDPVGRQGHKGDAGEFLEIFCTRALCPLLKRI